VETQLDKKKNLFQLLPESSIPGLRGSVLKIGRYLVGRTESCDVVVPSGIVSSVHAVLEVTPREIKIYDMNSKNGTFLNGDKVISSVVKTGDKLSFGNIEFTVSPYQGALDLPPVLDALEPVSGAASVIRTLPEVPPANDLPKTPTIEEEVPYIVYPLSSDPNSDYSEYIFEDKIDLYPIFKYEHNKQSVEIIILFNDKVFSVDYLPEKNGEYKIAGATTDSKEIEFPYLGKDEKVPFVEINSGNCVIHQLHNYNMLQLTDEKIVESNDGRVNLQENDIVKLTNDQLEIYIRKVSAPPKVKAAPFFSRDNTLRKYLALILLFVLLPVLALNLYTVDEELKKEKDPERIATILYKQKLIVNKNKAVEKTKKKKVTKQKAKKKQVVKKKTPKKKQAAPQKSNKTKKVTSNPGKKSAAKKQVVKKVKNPAPKRKKIATKKTSSAASKRRSSAKTRRANTPSKNVGRVDVYKNNFNFKSSINNLMAKGGTLKGAKTASSNSSSLTSASVSGGVATNLRKASVGNQVGSLTGATVGKLGESKGMEGLSTKTGVYTAGIPSETVIVGSMDPDVIRRILREHIPQFRYCYQKELDRSSNRDISGMIRLLFTIGASGHVSRAGVDGRTKLPSHVKKCVVGVLRGIQFPRPMGGGTVDVKQPFNFYPKRL
jgi:outer membrane biosynthesis protein TonB